MTEGIKNIIFDFGGIIVDLNKQAAIDAFRALGFHTEKYINDYVQAGIFSELELGLTSEEEFYAFVCRQAEKEIDHKVIRDAWNRMLTGIPARRMQAIKQLREHYRIYMLSNTNSIHWTYSCHTLFPSTGFRPEECFDRIFLSQEIHMAKPDPAAFRHVLDNAGLQAEESLFIDDSAANCAAAQTLGLKVFHSERADDWLEIIK